MNKKKVVLDYVIIILSAIMSAISFQLFVAPNNFAPAGFGGIAMMLEYLLGGFSIFGYFSLIVNVPLCIFAYFCINKEFGVRSFVFCVVTALSYIILDLIDIEPLKYVATGGDAILPCAIGGIIAGANYGIIIRRETSTGGTDIIAKYASKKNPLLNFFWVTFILNAVVAVTSFFVYAYRPETGEMIFDYQPVVLCVLYCFISSWVGNVMLKGTKSAFKFIIVTTHAEEINREIIEKLNHGATQLQGVGVYTSEPRAVLICVVGKHQIVEFKNILEKYDNTFSFIENVSETIGLFRHK